MEKTKKELFTRALVHGGVLTCRDCSRKIASDRWVVALECRAIIPLPAGQAESLKQGDDPQLTDCIAKYLGNSLEFSTTREIQFVAAEDKEEKLQELLSRLLDNISTYLDNPAFPGQLLKRRYEELRERCLRERSSAPVELAEEEEGPADFSDLFRP
jgi:hypothetical protein